MTERDDRQDEKVSHDPSIASVPKTAKAVPVKKAASPKPARQRIRTTVKPEDRAGLVGAPGLLTKELADRLISVIETGVPLDVSLAFVGVHRDTLRKWRRRGSRALELKAGVRSENERKYADFCLRLDTAVASVIVAAQTTLKRLVTGPQLIDKETGEVVFLPMSDTELRIQADLLKFFLSRRDRANYGASIRADVTAVVPGTPINADMNGEQAVQAMKEMFPAWGVDDGDDDE